jgi:hypothetical protein
MAVSVTNRCAKTYRSDPEKVVSLILERIPEKFLVGLGEVILLDKGKPQYPMMRYVNGQARAEPAKIEIYMDNKDFSGLPFFSLLALNVHFSITVNEHIRKYLKPKTHDQEILTYPSERINYDWTYFGPWQFVVVLFKLMNHLMSRVNVLKKIESYLIRRLLDNVEKYK